MRRESLPVNMKSPNQREYCKFQLSLVYESDRKEKLGFVMDKVKIIHLRRDINLSSKGELFISSLLDALDMIVI